MKKKPRNPKNPYNRPKPRNRKPAVLAACAAMILVLAAGLAYRHFIPPEPADNEITRAFQAASDRLRIEILGQTRDESVFSVLPGNKYAVFLTCSNGEFIPETRHGAGDDLISAWDAADRRMRLALQDSNYAPTYLKCSVVSEVAPVTYEELQNGLRESDVGKYHWGVAFDKNFNTALLEQECNYMRLYDYNQSAVSLDYVNAYLSNRDGVRALSSVPGDLYAFRCAGWVYDINSDEIEPLSSEDDIYGIREFPLTEDNMTLMCATAGFYLTNNLYDATGKFVYTRWPMDDDVSVGYSIVRHTAALKTLADYYNLTGDVYVQAKMHAGIEFLSDYTITEDGCAYVRCTEDDDVPGEIRLGAAGTLLSALAAYETSFNDGTYRALLDHVAAGILKYQAPDGHVPHVLYQDLTVKADSFTPFYDGETVLGLCDAYNLTGDGAYLDAAVRLMDYCLDNGYAREGDQWFAMSLLELIKIFPGRQEYYDAAFMSVHAQQEMFRGPATDPTYLEHLTAVLEIYGLAVANDDITVPPAFGVPALLGNIKYQARMLTNQYLFPEKAMHAAIPTDVIGAFYYEEPDSWKVRIDAVQHAVGAYGALIRNYGLLTELCETHGVDW